MEEALNHILQGVLDGNITAYNAVGRIKDELGLRDSTRTLLIEYSRGEVSLENVLEYLRGAISVYFPNRTAKEIDHAVLLAKAIMSPNFALQNMDSRLYQLRSVLGLYDTAQRTVDRVKNRAITLEEAVDTLKNLSN